MKKLIIGLFAALSCGVALAQYNIVSEANTAVGPVVQGKLNGDSTLRYLPFSAYATGSPVIATEAFAMPRSGADISSPFNLNGVGGANKVWLSKHNTGQGNTDAPKDLTADSQYLVIGGREYSGGSFRGIGLGYTPNTSSISPVFIGMQEQNEGGATSGNIVFATRYNLTNTAPIVRLRVLHDGKIRAADDYTPTSDQDLATKKYVDAAIKAAIDALQKAPQ